MSNEDFKNLTYKQGFYRRKLTKEEAVIAEKMVCMIKPCSSCERSNTKNCHRIKMIT